MLPVITVPTNNLVVSLLVVEHRKLLRPNSKQWIPMTITYLTDLPMKQVRSTIADLIESSLFQDFRIGQMTADCRNLLEMLCQRYLSHDLRSESHILLYQLDKLFVFMEDDVILQQLTDKVFGDTLLTTNRVLMYILNGYYQGGTDSKFVKKVTLTWMEKLSSHRQHLIETLKATVAIPKARLRKGQESKAIAKALEKTIPYFTDSNPPKKSSFTEDDLSLLLPNILYLLKLCNDLKMKEKGSQLYWSFAYSSSFDWFNKQVMREIQRFVSFAGWAVVNPIIEAILSEMSNTGKTACFLTELVIVFLSRNEPLSNAAAVTLFQGLLVHLFSQRATVFKVKFFEKKSTMQEEEADGFLVTVVMLEHHQLLDQKSLMKMSVSYFEKHSIERLITFYRLLDSSLLSTLASLNQTTLQCYKILQLISRRVVKEDFLVGPDVNTLRPLCKAIVWMEDPNLTEQWINKICRHNSTECFNSLPLKSSLVLAEYFNEHSPDLALKIAKLQMEWNKQLQHYLNDNVSSLTSTIFKGGEPEATLELDKIITFLLGNPILGDAPSDDVKEDVALNLKTLLQFCRMLDAKEQGIHLLKSYVGCRGVDWCERSLLKQLAMFLNSIELGACIGFIGHWLAGPNFNLTLLEKILSSSSPDAEVNLLAKNLMEAAEIQADPNFITVKGILDQNKKIGNNRRRRRRSLDNS